MYVISRLSRKFGCCRITLFEPKLISGAKGHGSWHSRLRWSLWEVYGGLPELPQTVLVSHNY